jgi:hypothetical protein
VIGAATEVDNEPADDLSWIRFMQMARKDRIKVHTKPITSITTKASAGGNQTERRRLRFKVAKKTSANPVLSEFV